MAYTSVIPVRRLDRAVKYVMNKEKTTAVSLQDALDYAANRDKTEKSCFESSYACTLETAFADMRKTKERWHKSGGVQGYHLVQSFAADEVTPELAHQIAKELADRVLGARYEYVIGTHLNTDHIHSHIVWNSVSCVDGKKYRSNYSQYPKEAGAWNPPAVQSILTNEKYRGDTCCQKRYTPDTLPLQKKRNKSQLPKYYIQESHPAIIMPTDFEKVQALLSQKRTHRSQMHSYPLTKMAVCQFCGKMLSPKTRANGVRVWNCKTHIVDSTQCPIKPVYETELYGAFLSMYNKLFENRATLFLPIFNDLQRIQDIKSMQNEASNAVHTEILQISKQLHNLTRIHAQGYIEETVYQERRIRIEQQLAEKKKCLTCQKQNGTAEKALYQTKQIDRYMQNHTALTEFDEEAMRTIVKKIVVSNEAFVFELPNGLHLKEKR